MNPVHVYSYAINLASGGVMNVPRMGSFFRLFDTTGELDVAPDSGGLLEGLLSGQGLENYAFNALQITNNSGATVTGRILVASEKFVDQRIVLANAAVEEVALTDVSQAAGSVSNASANLLAANADRRYLFVQNNHASAIVYVNIAGAVATATNGIKLNPGGDAFEMKNPPLGAITAIGSIAGPNTDVVVIEAE